MSSLFNLVYDSDGRVSAEQTITDADGKPKALKGDVSRIDIDAYNNIGNIVVDVARRVAEHDDIIRERKEAAGHDSKVLAALMLGLRAATKIGNETDWQGKSAAVGAAVAQLMETSVEPFFAAQLAEARGSNGTGEQVHDLLVSRRKKRASMYSAANTALARMFRDGIGINDEGISGERAKAVVALFEGDGIYANIYPAAALRVLKSGLPESFWKRAQELEAKGKGTLRLKTPEQVKRAETDKQHAADERAEMLKVTTNATPEFVAEAIQAATVRTVSEVNSDNFVTVVQGMAAAARLNSGQLQFLSEQFEGLETVENLSISAMEVGALTLSNIATVLDAIHREAAALGNSARLFASSMADRAMNAAAAKLSQPTETPEVPDSDTGEPDGAEVPEAPETPEAPEAAKVTPIKSRARKPAARSKTPARSRR